MDTFTLIALFIIATIILYLLTLVWTYLGSVVGTIATILVVFFILGKLYSFQLIIHGVIYLAIAAVVLIGIFMVIDSKQIKKRKAFIQMRLQDLVSKIGLSNIDELMNYQFRKPVTSVIDLTPTQYWHLISQQFDLLNIALTKRNIEDRDTSFISDLIKSLNSLSDVLSQINKDTEIPLTFKNNQPINPALITGLTNLEAQFQKSEKGRYGEERVQRAIAYQGDLTKRLINYNVPFDYGRDDQSSRNTNQMDMVLINQQGIFILEIKNYSFDYITLQDDGNINYSSDGHNWYRSNNKVTKQMEQHRFAIKNILTQIPGIDIEPVSILVIANDKAKLTSKIDAIQMYKPDAFYSAVITPRPHILTEDEVMTIYQILSHAQVGEQTFSFPVFIDNFADNLLDLYSYVQTIQKLSELPKQTIS
ncbi:nuclease-related domain-containing protein [Lentilactobacillus raoultii]|uniref:Nuclease-related domain-containing protein n=1 Tax=Lentilactobacillus raoultii TaxID=1987503 RepID=A0ABW3PIM2_9LACO|nr:nuclease-related domain-containing protein [Lentilactobacillus raoultii]